MRARLCKRGSGPKVPTPVAYYQSLQVLRFCSFHLMIRHVVMILILFPHMLD